MTTIPDDVMALMVDAAMTEMSGIHPPMRRTECERLIRAALAVNLATYRHRERGTEYVLIGIGRMQTETWVRPDQFTEDFYRVDMDEVAVYRDVEDGSLWVRPREEFEDGRFEAIAAAPKEAV